MPGDMMKGTMIQVDFVDPSVKEAQMYVLLILAISCQAIDGKKSESQVCFFRCVIDNDGATAESDLNSITFPYLTEFMCMKLGYGNSLPQVSGECVRISGTLNDFVSLYI